MPGTFTIYVNEAQYEYVSSVAKSDDTTMSKVVNRIMKEALNDKMKIEEKVIRL